MNPFKVVVRSANVYGKITTYETETDTLVNATRIILSYVSKRGYEPFTYEIIKNETLI